jgi:hypothetical protein
LLASVSIVLPFIFSIGCSSESPSEEPTGEATGAILAGRTLTPAEVATDLRNAGFAENLIGKMTCVAKYESGFRERAQNHSFLGIFQIGKFHVGEIRGCPKTVDELFDAAKNARCAKGVYDAQGIKAWAAYAGHKSECDRAAAPRGSGGSSGSATPVPPVPQRKPAVPASVPPRKPAVPSSSSGDIGGGGDLGDDDDFIGDDDDFVGEDEVVTAGRDEFADDDDDDVVDQEFDDSNAVPDFCTDPNNPCVSI